MKKFLSAILVLVLALSVLSLAGCGSTTPDDTPQQSAQATATPEPTPLPDDIDPATVDVITETWVATELSFESTKEFDKNEQVDVIMDAVFTNKETGTSLTIPAFWDGDNTFRVRFAPTEYGVWEYTTKCESDESLNGKTGTVGANAYKGDLEVYKHGFVTADTGTKYLTYADGTPFFYLGDTHWSMYTEEMNKKGEHAGDIDTDSHFKYIVDKRVEQGFTVYQSEPIGAPFNVEDKFTRGDIKGFQTADLYYQYIAQKGLTHANAEFFFASAMTKKLAENLPYLEQISRYWVARFGAYPVMWTLAQEIDNDFYYERGDQTVYDYTNNPWVKVAEYLHKYDAYKHPLTGHQENTGATTVTGKGTGGQSSGGGMSCFAFADKNVTGHNWWGVQWSPSLTGQASEAVAKDYWFNEKPAVNYESRYCYLWTKNFGARAEGWISFLSGFCGYGYGAIDMWYYKSTYDINKESNDGIDTITPEDKATYWCDAIEFESAYQCGYMKSFFTSFEWWKLKPDFNNKEFFVPANDEAIYTCAHEDSNRYVIYFYAKNTSTGMLANMESGAAYTATWFNPRTCQYRAIEGDITANATDANGKPGYQLPAKPDAEDWVLLVNKK